jgi:hypothetical protein
LASTSLSIMSSSVTTSCGQRARRSRAFIRARRRADRSGPRHRARPACSRPFRRGVRSTHTAEGGERRGDER